MKKFTPFLEDVPLSYAYEHPQFYRNAAREQQWGRPVYFAPSTLGIGETGTSGPYYKKGHNANEKLGRYGNCTWFCICRHMENSNEIASFIIGAAGKAFDKYPGRKEGSLSKQIHIGNSIQAGDMLVWADDLDNSGNGHINYVEQVDEDIIHISESGWSTKVCYKDKTCITYVLDKNKLITGTKISLRPVQPYSEYLIGVIHTGDCYKDKETKKMKVFTKRLSKPNSSNKEYVRQASGGWSTCVQGSPKDSQCDTLANCVGYACGRFNEIINEIEQSSGMEYPSLNCNAENFIERAKQYYPDLVISNEPLPGAILVWRKGEAGKSSDGAGHVAIVEEILERDENGKAISIKTSESSYGGTAFYNAIRNYNNGNWVNWANYYFRGFILNPSVLLVEPVERDKSVDQVQVNTSVLRMRRTPSSADMSNYWGFYCPMGIFNVKKKTKNEDLEWYMIDDNVWIAGVEEVDFLKAEKSIDYKALYEADEVKLAKIREIVG